MSFPSANPADKLRRPACRQGRESRVTLGIPFWIPDQVGNDINMREKHGNDIGENANNLSVSCVSVIHKFLTSFLPIFPKKKI